MSIRALRTDDGQMTQRNSNSTDDVGLAGETAQAPTGERFLSEAECRSVFTQIAGLARQGGMTDLALESTWTGNVHWGRNEIDTSGDVQDTTLVIKRQIHGAENVVHLNSVTPAALDAAVRRAERLLRLHARDEDAALIAAVSYTEPYQVPQLWYDRTYQLDADARAAAMRQLVQSARDTGMLSAGYIEVAAHGRAAMNTAGRSLYHPFTVAQYSVTVRDPQGTGSGWAGVDWNDWGRIDGARLSAIALDKCLKSRNPVAIEPARYTTILEPQATCDFVSPLLLYDMARQSAENGNSAFAGTSVGTTRIGELVMDERVTIRSDPMDPETAFLPVQYGEESLDVTIFHPVTWIEHGVLKQLTYNRDYAVDVLGENTGLPMQGAFRMSGGPTSVDEMIATTTRGLLVTRFVNIQQINGSSTTCSGMTRDGVWLIERGKITKAVRNLAFTESVLGILNRVEQLGPPQRVFRPGNPTVVPPMKVQDFNFSSLVDAI